MKVPAYIKPETVRRVDAFAGKVVHIVTIATKPDIIKQAPIYKELESRGEFVLLCHTGQHHDFRYSGGMEEEFELTVDIRLGIDGDLNSKVAQMVERFGAVVGYLQAAGKTPIPYIHGDTSTAMGIGLASILKQVACVHVEAGIRTLTPKKEFYDKFYQAFKAGKFDWDEYYAAAQQRDNYELGSMEPYPEQVNTRMAEPASGYYAAPVELDREFLLNEGFAPSKVSVVGNSVVDATLKSKAEAKSSTIFDKYPQLLSGQFIRFCIHRRENTSNERRFTVLVDAIKKLVESGKSVLLISLFGTEEAIDEFGQRETIEQLARDYPETFIYSDVWPYYKDVIAAMVHCAAIATDSGSMQEEMNVLGVPCVTLRFGSDRGESFLAGGNIPAPPIDSDFVVAVVEGAVDNAAMRNAPKIYGENVSKKLVDEVLSRVDPDHGLFISEEDRIGLAA
jgi:UDP-N-acetylglucosamine 2-epimerase (non-hydrolysing)